MSFTRPISHLEVAELERLANALNSEPAKIPTDWAESLTQISQSVRKLEDALPRQDKQAVVEAVKALEENTQKLREFLEFRAVFSADVTFS